MVAPFAFLQGGIFPFLIRMSSCSGDTVSESAGIIYLWNAIGAFFISFLTHFFLLSFYGVQGTILLLVTIGICGSLIALLYFRAKKIIYGLVASVIVVSISAMIPGDYWFRVGIDPEKDFDYFEGSTGLVTIEWDEDGEAAVIKINGKENAFVPNHNGNTELAMFASSIKGDGAIIILGMGGGVIVEDLLRHDTIAKIDATKNLTEDIPFLSTLDYHFRRSVPALDINVYVYAEKKQDRFIMLEMTKYFSGQEISSGMTLKEIRINSLVVEYKNRSFQIKRK